MPATKSGIYHNLKESKYAISNQEIAFFFSSEFYLTKFMNGYHNNREKFKQKMKEETIDLNFDVLGDILYYKSIEKRGFLVWVKGVEMNWHDLQKYALRKMIEPNTPNWSRMQKPKLGERIKIMG